MAPRAPLVFCLALALAPIAANAEPTVPFKGEVKEKGTRNALPGALVEIPDANLSLVTDAEGRFTFPAVPVGKRKVVVRRSGFFPADTEETFNPGKSLEATYYILATQRYRTIVRADKLVKQTVEHSLDIEEIKRIPGTQGDPLKAIQTLPGVARAPFSGGQLIVWGSSPQDTRTYVDGVFIPTLYHFGGLRSTVNAELVQSLGFTPGGYGTDYGRGLGGVVEIDTRRPKTTGLHGYVGFDLIDGSLLIEGPLTKNLSIAVAARRSWIDLFLPLLTTNDFQLSPTYWDYQLALRWRASKRDDVDIFLFGSDDTIDLIAKNPDPELSAAVKSHIYFHRILARWVHRFAGGGTLSVTPSVGWDVPFQVRASFGSINLRVSAEVLRYNTRVALRMPIAQFLRLDAGIDFEGALHTIDLYAPARGMPREGESMDFGDLGGYTSDRVNLHRIAGAPYVAAVFTLLDKRLTIVPGLRADIYYFTGYQGSPDRFDHVYLEWEPRLAARFQVHKMVTLKASMGAYHQMPDASSFLKSFGNPKVRPQAAYHYVVGIDVNPTSTLHLELNAFYKDMQALVVRSSTERLDNGGVGRVVGGEILIRQQLWHGLFGWISYTLSQAERRDGPGEPWRLFSFDQTHILSLIASYELPRGFQVGVRFRYVTGNPTTPVASWYWDANADMYQRINGATNSDRLAAFHQLDIRFDKVFTYRLFKWAIYLDIQNVYNQQNPETIQYAPRPEDGSQPVAGIPFFPSLGFRGDF